LKAWRSARVRESDLAMTGTTLTTSDNFFKTTMSIGFSLEFRIGMRKEIRVSGRLNEEKTAVDTSILDISISVRSKFLP
jgi:hypothetical protein